jgi:uncharacterized protein (TIGR02300 family)
MATNKDRGTKRTCQNGDCGARFYDLSRNPIVCPICGSKYAIAHSPTAAAAIAQEERAQRKMKKPEFEPVKAEADSEAETEEALVVDVETDDADDAGAEADETFLEEEEEDGNVSDIVGGPAEGEEER